MTNDNDPIRRGDVMRLLTETGVIGGIAGDPLTDMIAAIPAVAASQTAALDRVRLEAKAEALNGPWSDEPDEMTPSILASHPVHTKDYATYAEALRLVSNRHSKGALVCLVNHLLASIP